MKKEKIQFTKHDLSEKALEWYNGMSLDIYKIDGVYYLQEDKIGTLEDINNAFEQYQDEFNFEQALDMLIDVVGESANPETYTGDKLNLKAGDIATRYDVDVEKLIDAYNNL